MLLRIGRREDEPVGMTAALARIRNAVNVMPAVHKTQSDLRLGDRLAVSNMIAGPFTAEGFHFDE